MVFAAAQRCTAGACALSSQSTRQGQVLVARSATSACPQLATSSAYTIHPAPVAPAHPARTFQCPTVTPRTTVIPASAASSSAETSRLQKVLAAIDAVNMQDPRTTEYNGQTLPYEYAYSLWLTEWVARLTADGNPPLSDELRIVARGQHIKRWVSPRSSYPEGKAAYLKWREDLKRMHASTVHSIMEAEGYTEASCNKVERIILKRDLARGDPENQVAEDALCLVFLQHQFSDFRTKPDSEKMVDILRKSWKKMSDKGRAEALKLPLGDEELELVKRALAA